MDFSMEIVKISAILSNFVGVSPSDATSVTAFSTLNHDIMSQITKTFTPAEAKAWVESREWANGFEVKADESINAVEFAQQYAANKELWDALFAFLRDADLKTIAAGKHDIIPGRVWVNILEYTPKDAAATKIESHENFIDLQWTFEGDEVMGVATGKVTPTGPYDPVKDRTNYTTEEEIVYSPAPADRFFLYFPCDMHQPSVSAKQPATPSRKAVGKIEYAK